MSLQEKRIKVLHVVDLSKTGGVEVMFMQYLLEANKFKEIKHEVFALRISDERRDMLKALEIKAYCPRDNSYNLSRRLSLIKLIRSNKYNIVHGQNSSGNLWATIGCLLRPKFTKLVSHEHGGSWGIKGLHRLLHFFWAWSSSVVICNSKAAMIIMNKRVYSKAKLILIYNGVASQINYKKQKNNEKFQILFAGRLEEVKGVRQLLLSLKELKEKNILFECNILGDGSLKDWIKFFIQQNKLSSDIYLKGVVKNVDDYMLNSDVLVLPSLREPLGNVIIEASRAGLPVVASNVDGIKEIIKHKKSGILIDPIHPITSDNLPKFVVGPSDELVQPMTLDSKKLSEELINCYENPSMLSEYGKNAREMLSHLTIQSYTSSLLTLYKELHSSK